MLSVNRTERRVQIGGIVLVLGLVVEVICLLRNGPIAFLMFSGVCVLLFLAGILLYLQLLVSSAAAHHSDAGHSERPQP